MTSHLRVPEPTAGATPAQGDTGRLVTWVPGVRGGGRCRIRVIDTFGTEPAYNHEEYATLHGYRTNWGYWNLNPKQFMTMFRECLAAPWSGAGWVGPLPGLGRRQARSVLSFLPFGVCVRIEMHPTISLG